MKRKEALSELIDKVETGEIAPDFGVVFQDHRVLAAKAYHDMSLDAAKALHEAVLGEDWTWNAYDDGQASVALNGSAEDGDYFGEIASNTARAWLLAILRALHSQEQAANETSTEAPIGGETGADFSGE